MSEESTSQSQDGLHDSRPEYEPPRALRLEDGRVGLGLCANGSDAVGVFGCLGLGLSAVGTSADGLAADSSCDLGMGVIS